MASNVLNTLLKGDLGIVTSAHRQSIVLRQAVEGVALYTHATRKRVPAASPTPAREPHDSRKLLEENES